jgi:hypothetical protein
MMRVATALLAMLAFASGARADALDFNIDGYADFRLVIPSTERGWLDGGLGKFRFGGNQPDPNFRFTEATAQATLDLSDDVRVVVVPRLEPEQRSGIDLLESYVVYRPSVDGWLGSLKVGAFFPPFSLENTDLGWTSPYTLTASAINSWVGDELRTIGAEAHVERTTSAGIFTLTAALTCCNDPAGVLMADRGWTLDDRPTGLFENVRTPDATLELFHAPFPDRTPLFLEIDHSLGWYAGASWSRAGIGKVTLYRYDNEGNPAAHQDDYYAWRTRFWSAGWESHLGSLSLLAQGLSGDTAIQPFPGFVANTKYKSTYFLAAYDIDDVRLAARIEAFQTRDPSSAGMLDEDGHAFTAAATWNAKDWLRLSAEAIALDSRRGERILEGVSADRNDTQIQFGVRVFY